MHDADLLAAVPEFLSISNMLKATPAEEGGKRYIYMEASREALDQQNEIVLAKALSESADYYLRYGNVDLSHYSILGPKNGIENPHQYEIGRPVHVKIDGKQTFVKAELYDGTGPMAANADMVWKSLTQQRPPATWYPSVGGQVLEKSIDVDPETKARVAVVRRVRWNNVALDKRPVNQHVEGISTVPMAALAKCWTSGGLHFAKALTAGYGTDSATLEGGAALREQSLQGVKPLNYFDFRERMARDLTDRKLHSPDVHSLIKHAVDVYRMPLEDAAASVERFMRDIKNGLQARRRK